MISFPAPATGAHLLTAGRRARRLPKTVGSISVRRSIRRRSGRCLWAASNRLGLGHMGDDARDLLREVESRGNEIDAAPMTASFGARIMRLILPEGLVWIVAAPGTRLPPDYDAASAVRWRIREDGGHREQALSLQELTELLPAVSDWAIGVERERLGVLLTCRAAGDATTEPYIKACERELAPFDRPAERDRPTMKAGRWTVDIWRVPAHAAAFAATEDLAPDVLVGDERDGRLHVRLTPVSDPAGPVVEFEVDVRKSLVTLHSVEGQPAVHVGGRGLDRQLSIGVVESLVDEGEPILQAGRSLAAELARVVESR